MSVRECDQNGHDFGDTPHNLPDDARCSRCGLAIGRSRYTIAHILKHNPR